MPALARSANCLDQAGGRDGVTAARSVFGKITPINSRLGELDDGIKRR